MGVPSENETAVFVAYWRALFSRIAGSVNSVRREFIITGFGGNGLLFKVGKIRKERNRVKLCTTRGHVLLLNENSVAQNDDTGLSFYLWHEFLLLITEQSNEIARLTVYTATGECIHAVKCLSRVGRCHLSARSAAKKEKPWLILQTRVSGKERTGALPDRDSQRSRCNITIKRYRLSARSGKHDLGFPLSRVRIIEHRHYGNRSNSDAHA